MTRLSSRRLRLFSLFSSSGKGIAHTLARRAAFFLATNEHDLALRDLSIALEYGVLEQEELLEFLLSHHITDESRVEEDKDTMSRTMHSMRHLHDPNVGEQEKHRWASQIKETLSATLSLNKNKKLNPAVKKDMLRKIFDSIRTAAVEHNLESLGRPEELAVPRVEERNPVYPGFSEAAAIFHDTDGDKGRGVRARRDILAGEVIGVDDPIAAILCPENFDNIRSHCLHCFAFTKAPLPCEVSTASLH